MNLMATRFILSLKGNYRKEPGQQEQNEFTFVKHAAIPVRYWMGHD
jgi:hypothetical protein